MPLGELLAYFAPFAQTRRDEAGVTRLLTPAVNVLGLNAAYVAQREQLDVVRRWTGKEPPLVASTFACPGREVARLQVGTFRSGGVTDPDIVVEQLSRLHLATWTDVLAASHGTPGWGPHLARHFARCLEQDRRSVLLLAYAGSRPAGALLWRGVAGSGAAHLWGSLTREATAALLGAAAELGGGRVRVSVPWPAPVRLEDSWEVQWTLLDG